MSTVIHCQFDLSDPLTEETCSDFQSHTIVYIPAQLCNKLQFPRCILKMLVTFVINSLQTLRPRI